MVRALYPAVRATPAARTAVNQLRAQHGPLLFIESHGCCDNRAPICLPVADFMVGTCDVQVAEVAGCPYYIDARVLDRQPLTPVITEYELDVEPGYADGMSLAPPGQHFTLRLPTPGLIAAAALREATPKSAAPVHLVRPPADQVRGSKRARESAITVVNSAGLVPRSGTGHG